MRSYLSLAILCTFACASSNANQGAKRTALPAVVTPTPPGDMTSTKPAAPPVLIKNATIMTAAGAIHSPGHVLVRDGRIAAVGAGDLAAPQGTRVVDGQGMFVTPGIIDTHSHMGVYALPYMDAHQDGNEMSSPTTPEVWAEHAVWPQDPALARAASYGVTTVQVLPGSANLIGGRSAVIKLKPATNARAMRFPGAPQGLKMACGENPKRVYGEKGRAPQTRMGDIAGFRAAFQSATEYRRKWQVYERDLKVHAEKKDEEEDPPDAPERDLGLETLTAMMDGKILLHVHCYRADDMQNMLDVAQEFGFRIRSFHHAVEAYKLAHRLAEAGVAVSTWADWWGFKMEAFDGIPYNVALLAAAKARPIMHSDSSTEVRFLNQQAAKARAAGAQLGLAFSDDEVLRWVTANPAWALGIEDQTGTLEVGKMGDVVLWSASPFSIYARAKLVVIDGEVIYEDGKPMRPTDFELGTSAIDRSGARREAEVKL